MLGPKLPADVQHNTCAAILGGGAFAFELSSLPDEPRPDGSQYPAVEFPMRGSMAYPVRAVDGREPPLVAGLPPASSTHPFPKVAAAGLRRWSGGAGVVHRVEPPQGALPAGGTRLTAAGLPCSPRLPRLAPGLGPLLGASERQTPPRLQRWQPLHFY